MGWNIDLPSFTSDPGLSSYLDVLYLLSLKIIYPLLQIHPLFSKRSIIENSILSYFRFLRKTKIASDEIGFFYPKVA